MYGLIGRFVCHPGTRTRLADILSAPGSMPGCLSYVVALDTDDENGLWVTELWTDAAAHDASLRLPEVQAAIAEGRQFIVDMDHRYVTKPVGGIGLDPSVA